jgi:O-succinylhomoserine sulfhydrylase
VRAQAETALHVASHLEGHNKLTRVLYPYLASHPQHDVATRQMGAGGTVVSFDIAGGQAAAFRFLNELEIVTISNNLGDAKSIITHPATTTHQRLTEAQRDALGITPGLVRLSLGIEDKADLLSDLTRALEAA